VFHDNPTPTYKDLLNVVIGRIKVFIQHVNGPNLQQRDDSHGGDFSFAGTVFVVDVEDDDGTTVVAVDDGLVQVRNLTAPGPEPMLKPGDAIRIYRGQPLIAKLVDHKGMMRGHARSRRHDSPAGATRRWRRRRTARRRRRAGNLRGPQGDKGKNGNGSGTGCKHRVLCASRRSSRQQQQRRTLA